jgi:superoxide dismutase
MPDKPRKSRWTSLIVSPARGRLSRGLEEETNPKHRARVEYNKDTILVHLSDEDGSGWTVLVVDRKTRLALLCLPIFSRDTHRMGLAPRHGTPSQE